ncbi:unnamed protein product [Polarella glacialis]|uniref:DNA polymerase zeta catalytic subunit n=1 Tax=Polarella glacialis TaxID=89957 RepID=A0A813GN65_POLGL|nr:unnamed protein product [Polarella glacialis]
MKSISFSLTALDMQMVEPVSGLDDLVDLRWPCLLGRQPQKVPVIRLFGVSRQGASVCAHVHGFRPFFYAELSEEAAAALKSRKTQSSASTSTSVGNQLPEETEEAEMAKLAAAIEATAARAGRPQGRIVGLRLERWRSIYGLRLQASPFLRLELLDPRDVEPVAAMLQRGEVSLLGCAQAHEAHLPFLLHFLSEHHICGGGVVRVCGHPRPGRESSSVASTGSTTHCQQTCCSVELDISAPQGMLNLVEYRELLRRTGVGPEARALASLRSQLGEDVVLAGSRPKAQEPSLAKGAVVSGGENGSRPLPAARTTPLAVRHALHRWLAGGQPPGPEAASSLSAAAAGVAAALHAAGQTATIPDLEDMVAPLAPGGLKERRCRFARAPASPARFSDPADDPRSRSISATHPLRNPSPSDDTKPTPVADQSAMAQASPMLNMPAAASTSCSSDVQWEDLASVLSLEILGTCSAKQNQSRPGDGEGDNSYDPTKDSVDAVCYALRPHGCVLGGRRLQPPDQRGAIVVAESLSKQEEWKSSMPPESMKLQLVSSEEELLEALVDFVRKADPDVCLGWEVRSRSWGFLLARARVLGRQDLRRALSRAPFDASPLPLPMPGQASTRGSSGQQDPSTYESEMVAPSELQLPGRLLLNVWRLLMHVTFGTKLRSYAPQEAAKELLGRSMPQLATAELSRLWSEAEFEGRLAALKHVTDRAALSLEVLDSQQMLPRAGELSRLFGMDVLSGFTRGTQLRVESLLMRVAHAAGFLLLSASQEQVRQQPALECLPLVMEPSSGYYWDPVLVLDFKGMYPSLIVAHNISFDTCLGHSRRTGPGPSCQLGVLSSPWQLGKAAAACFEQGDALVDVSADCPVQLAPTLEEVTCCATFGC